MWMLLIGQTAIPWYCHRWYRLTWIWTGWIPKTVSICTNSTFIVVSILTLVHVQGGGFISMEFCIIYGIAVYRAWALKFSVTARGGVASALGLKIIQLITGVARHMARHNMATTSPPTTTIIDHNPLLASSMHDLRACSLYYKLLSRKFTNVTWGKFNLHVNNVKYMDINNWVESGASFRSTFCLLLSLVSFSGDWLRFLFPGSLLRGEELLFRLDEDKPVRDRQWVKHINSK